MVCILCVVKCVGDVEVAGDMVVFLYLCLKTGEHAGIKGKLVTGVMFACCIYVLFAELRLSFVGEI